MTELEDAVARNRRGQLVGLGFLAAVIAVAVLIGTGAFSSGDPKGSLIRGVRGTDQTTALLRGVPQHGLVLGDPNAPATIVEFVDVKCPFCKSFALKDAPDVVKDLVRPGKANVELRLVGFLGPDSFVGRTAVHALAAQNKAWYLSELLYWNQKPEGEQWVGQPILRKIAGVAPELRGAPIVTTPTPATKRLDAQTDALRSMLDVKATPTIFVRKRGATAKGDFHKVDLKGTGSKASKIENAVKDLGG